jgi:hypothetical protein
MTKIFIEAKSNKTSEYHFLQAIINNFLPEAETEFIFMNGIGNLFNETIQNQIKVAQEMGEHVIVLADADTVAKGYGYEIRKEEIDKGMAANDVSFHYFLYPNNQNDGDVESLMESAVQRELHSAFFDCFEDYEKCVSGVKDESGEQKYDVPNLKGKLHTYMSAQKLSRKLSNRFGSGDWLFDNKDYWDLDVETLQPLKDFLTEYLK